MKCNSCGLEYPSEESFKKTNLCLVCYRQKMLFWRGFPAGVLFFLILSYFRLSDPAILVAAIIAGGTARGGWKGAGYAFLACFVGGIIFFSSSLLGLSSLRSDFPFQGLVVRYAILKYFFISLFLGVLGAIIGIIPGIIHKVVTKTNPIYKLHEKLKSDQMVSHGSLSVEGINENRRAWSTSLKDEIIEALKSRDETENEWAKSELEYYKEIGIKDALEIIKEYKL